MLQKHRPLITYDPNLNWVDTKEGGYYRRKRGTVKEAVLNETLKKYQQVFTKISPVTRRLKSWLKPYTSNMYIGRLHAKLNAALVKSFMKNGKLNFTHLKDFEFSKDHPFAKIHSSYPVEISAAAIRTKLPVKHYLVEKVSDVVTGFYYELIIVAGDLMKEAPLFRYSVKSQEYEFDTDYQDCLLEVPLPTKGTPWMAMIKFHTMEGKVKAINPRHYSMRVVAVGD